MDEEKQEGDQPRTPGGERHLAVWARWLLGLYPRAWRDRYGDEVAVVLAEHQITCWTTFDLLLGALDAHLHRDLLPGWLQSLAHRLRSSEIVIFCSFILFCLAWIPLRFVRDPLPVWHSATSAHPELLTSLTLLDVGGSIATLAVLVGGVPLLFTALSQAIAARRWRLLGLFAVPVFAAITLLISTLVVLPASTAHQSSAVGAPLTLLAVVLQLGLIVLWLSAIGGSVAAIAAALLSSDLGEGVLRFALLPARITMGALALGMIGAIVLTTLIFTEAPQLSSWPPLHVGDLLLMFIAVMLAGIALRHGIGAVSAESHAR
jgi:hypothetical protein